MATSLSPRGSRALSTVGVLAVTGYAGLVAWAAPRTTYQNWVPLVFLPALLLVSIPMLVRAGRRDPDPRFLSLLAWAFVLKAASTVARYAMAFVLYDGVADAAVYDDEGARLAAHYRNGDFAADIGRDFVGTGFVRVVTGVVYAVTGPSIFVGYAVFSWLGFWGLYFLYRAFRVAIPDGDARRYALLVLLLPSMLFWPSGLGKEAWMTFAIGLSAYGTARLVMQHTRWLVPLGLGLTAAALVRPHVAAALVAGIAAAYLLGRRARPASELTPLARALGVAVVAVAVWVAASRTADFLGVEEVSVTTVDAALENTTERTDDGDSAFEATPVSSPADFPVAFVSVVFRPFVFEANNAQMLLSAVEGTLLMFLVVLAVPRIASVSQRLRRQPYLLMCLVYVALFVYGFSNFANFGILVRERVQVLPFVLVLLALPRARVGTAVPSDIRSRAHTGGEVT